MSRPISQTKVAEGFDNIGQWFFFIGDFSPHQRVTNLEDLRFSLLNLERLLEEDQGAIGGVLVLNFDPFSFAAADGGMLVIQMIIIANDNSICLTLADAVDLFRV